MARRRDKGLERKIARERVTRLVELADRAARAGRLDRADRYVDLARRLSLRYQLRSPPPLRGRYCRRCRAYFLPGRTCRVRVREGRVVTTCLKCGYARRRPLAPKG